MDHRSDDSRKTPRQRAVLPPFVAPRAPTPQQGTPPAPAPTEPPRRRAAQLFTPPSEALPSLRTPATPAASVTAPPTPMREPEAEPAPPAAPRRDEDALVVEKVEAKDIELTITGEQPLVGGEPGIQVIAYEEANNLLRATTPEGRDPEVDGLRFEATELSLEVPAPNRLQVESFWASDPFHGPATVPPRDEPAGADEPEPLAREVAREMAPARDEERGAHEHAHASTPTPEADVVDDDAFAWERELGHVTSAARNEPAIEPERREPPEQWEPHSPAALEQLKETEPWTAPSVVPRARDARDAVGDALERVARRIRAGEVVLASEASAWTDESALAAALAALLRSR